MRVFNTEKDYSIRVQTQRFADRHYSDFGRFEDGWRMKVNGVYSCQPDDSISAFIRADLEDAIAHGAKFRITGSRIASIRKLAEHYFGIKSKASLRKCFK